MKILFSKSGSSGNSSVIESSDGHLLAIDAGIKYNIVNREIGYGLHLCRNLLVSHAHQDHSNYANEYSKRGMTIFSGLETAKELEYICSPWMKIYGNKITYEVDGFKFIPLEMVHNNSDGTPCECYGFLIQDVYDGSKLLWCTDTMYIPYQFHALEFYAIEANFWEQDDYVDDMDAIEKSVEQRRVRAHMSVESAVDFLKKQDLRKCKEIRLLHLSTGMTVAERARIVPYVKEQLGGDYNVVI